MVLNQLISFWVKWRLPLLFIVNLLHGPSKCSQSQARCLQDLLLLSTFCFFTLFCPFETKPNQNPDLPLLFLEQHCHYLTFNNWFFPSCASIPALAIFWVIFIFLSYLMNLMGKVPGLIVRGTGMEDFNTNVFIFPKFLNYITWNKSDNPVSFEHLTLQTIFFYSLNLYLQKLF